LSIYHHLHDESKFLQKTAIDIHCYISGRYSSGSTII
jgi:hypothetical protein